MEREAHLQGILCISQKPHLSGSPVKEPSIQVPLWSPSQSDAPSLEPSNISSRVPSEGAPPPDPLHGASSGREKETLQPQSSLYHLSKSPVDEPSSRFPKWGPYGRRCPSSEPFFHMSYRVPSKAALPPGSLNRAPTGRDPPPLEPLSTTSQSPLQVTQLSPQEEEAHVRCEGDHSRPSSAKVRNEWSYTSTPRTCLHDGDRENFTYLFKICSTCHCQ